MKMKLSLVAKQDLPYNPRIDYNFLVSFLKPAYERFPLQRQLQPPLLETASPYEDTNEVESILDSSLRRGKVQYLIRWE